jgi:hypothetical protein
MCAWVSQPPLPDELDPKRPAPTRFRIVPPPRRRPELLPDEARFTLRLSLLVGCAELAAWAWFASAGPRGAVLGWAALRLLKPVWSLLGTRLPRPALAFSLLFLALFGTAASLMSRGQLITAGLLAVALPAVGDLCASCAGDTITVERRSTAYAWLDMAQGLGGALGVALGLSLGTVAAIVGVAALLAGGYGVPDLKGRGAPRSTWTSDAYVDVLRSPFGSQIVALAFFSAFLAMQPFAKPLPGWVALLLPLVGMALAARFESYTPNAVMFPRIVLGVAALGLLLPPVRLLALGALFATLPASVARGAGEMERPLASSLAWSAMTLGAAVGAVL